MNKILVILKQKSTWAGIAAIATGIGMVVGGNLDTGIQTVIGGISVIFMRQAIEKSGPTK